jgi:hypothetical protein
MPGAASEAAAAEAAPGGGRRKGGSHWASRVEVACVGPGSEALDPELAQALRTHLRYACRRTVSAVRGLGFEIGRACMSLMEPAQLGSVRGAEEAKAEK